jgi:hypothetical protein
MGYAKISGSGLLLIEFFEFSDVAAEYAWTYNMEESICKINAYKRNCLVTG